MGVFVKGCFSIFFTHLFLMHKLQLCIYKTIYMALALQD